MKNDQRILVDSIARYCEANGVSLQALSHTWILQMRRGSQVHHVFGYDFGLNSSTALRICNDKAATSEILAACGIAAVPHRLFLHPRLFDHVHVAGNWRGLMEAFEQFGGDVVCKDNEGTSGREVLRARSLNELEQQVTRLLSGCRTIAVSPFIDVESELRFVFLDGECMLSYGKERLTVKGDGVHSVRALLEERRAADIPDLPTEAFEDLAVDLDHVPAGGEELALQWRHNLGRGACPTLHAPDDPELAGARDMARAAMRAVGARFGSVDLVRYQGGHLVLEINSGVMLEHVCQWHREGAMLADGIYHAALDRLWSASAMSD